MRFALKEAPVCQLVKNAVSASAVIGCDETEVKVDGSNYWFWTYPAEEHALLAIFESRGLIRANNQPHLVRFRKSNTLLRCL